jgi:hypothetical protein
MEFLCSFILFIRFLLKYKYTDSFSTFNANHLGSFKGKHRIHYAHLLKGLAIDDLALDALLPTLVSLFDYYPTLFRTHRKDIQATEHEDVMLFLDVLLNDFKLSSKYAFDDAQLSSLRTSKRTMAELQNISVESDTMIEIAKLRSDFEKINSLLSSSNNNVTHSSTNSSQNSQSSFSSFNEAKFYIKNSLDKILRYNNHIKIFDTHLSNNTTPPSLFYNRFPQPFLADDNEFVNKYNNLISEFQVNTLNLCKEFLVARVEKIEAGLLSIKGSLISDTTLDSKLADLKTESEARLKDHFQISNEKALRAKSIKFTVRDHHKNSRPKNHNSPFISSDNFNNNSSNNFSNSSNNSLRKNFFKNSKNSHNYNPNNSFKRVRFSNQNNTKFYNQFDNSNNSSTHDFENINDYNLSNNSSNYRSNQRFNNNISRQSSFDHRRLDFRTAVNSDRRF